MNTTLNQIETRTNSHEMNGETRTWETEHMMAIVDAAGERREVELKRLKSDNPKDPNRYHWQVGADVLVRFPTGTKLHRTSGIARPQNDGSFTVVVCGFRNANRCRIVRWADDHAGSGWNA